MGRYKAIATVTWCFDTEKELQDSFKHARHQLEQILYSEPNGSIYQGFTVQVDLATLKEKKQLQHIKYFDPEEILTQITNDETRKDFEIDGVIYSVKMNSDRYFVFRRSLDCIACGLRGNKMSLDINPGDNSPHFNLYGEQNGRMVLMTKDHIIPKSKGGGDVQSNYVTMCAICNNLKGNSNLTTSQIQQLRELNTNPNKLPRKELRQLLGETRRRLEADNTMDMYQDKYNLDDIPSVILLSTDL